MTTLTLQEKTETEVKLDASVTQLIGSFRIKGDDLIIRVINHPANYLLVDRISDVFGCDQEEVIENFQKDKQLILPNVKYRKDKDNIILYRKEYSIIVS